MFRFAADENFYQPVIDGLLGLYDDLDIVRVQDVGYRATDDRIILEWAAREKRIIISHDIRTMKPFAYERVAAGLPMAGLFLIPEKPNPGLAIEELVTIIEASDPFEWVDRVEHLKG